MIKLLRDLSCPNTLDCNKIYGLEDGRRAVRGDKPDAALLAELGPLPDHEGVVIVEPELFDEVREVLTLGQLGEFVAEHPHPGPVPAGDVAVLQRGLRR